MRYNFEWDLAKARQNLRKHHVSFKRAAMVFRDPHAVSIFDEEHSREEDRWITMGTDHSGTILVMIHTFRRIDESSYAVRIISARKATKRERVQYEEWEQ
ncbi:MAG: BrnT family toxin [Desulfomonilaceae bacterium]|nr:BrnT family toxin [Desulfomonilaceae bacterium]